MSGEGRPVLDTVDANELTLAILGTRWHEEITDALLQRAAAAAVACGIDDPLVLRVAGAVEVPVVAVLTFGIVIGKPVVRGNKFTILNDASTITHFPVAG